MREAGKKSRWVTMETRGFFWNAAATLQVELNFARPLEGVSLLPREFHHNRGARVVDDLKEPRTK